MDRPVGQYDISKDFRLSCSNPEAVWDRYQADLRTYPQSTQDLVALGYQKGKRDPTVRRIHAEWEVTDSKTGIDYRVEMWLPSREDPLRDSLSGIRIFGSDRRNGQDDMLDGDVDVRESDYHGKDFVMDDKEFNAIVRKVVELSQ